MKKLLIITGDLATGKSTWADKLAALYHAVVLHKDDVKEVLGDRLGCVDRAQSLLLSQSAVDIMLHGFEHIAPSRQNVILEANYHADELPPLLTAAKRHGYDVLALVLTADTDILYQRYCDRIAHENRHPVHTINGFDDRQGFTDYVLRGRLPSLDCATIHVNATTFAYQTDRTLADEINRFWFDVPAISVEQSAMAVVVCGDKLLTTVENIFDKLVLSLPKGHIEQGETAVMAAMREAQEETGVILAAEQAVRQLPPFATHFWDKHDAEIVKLIYPVVFDVPAMQQPICTEANIKSCSWMSIDEFIRNGTYNNVRNMVRSLL